MPDDAAIRQFLTTLHGEDAHGLEALHGGYWSSAYGYRSGGRELVLRLGDSREGFDMDRAAMRFAGPDLPVPDVLDVGEAFDGYYAVSVRHHGRHLETVAAGEADAARGALGRLLAALRGVPTPPDATPDWFTATPGSWRAWLRERLRDDPGRTVSGWRATLASDASMDRLYRECERRVESMLDACPERRDLVHGDLLHQNVLVTPDAARVSAVFSWKCSVRGDYLFDTAWCTFWGPWHPGIEAVDALTLTTSAPDLGSADLADAAARHHCYEVLIGATHLGWNAWTGDRAGLAAVARRTADVLECGPADV